MSLLIRGIDDPRQVAVACDLASDLVDSGWDFNLGWVGAHRWAVVPVREALLVGKEDAWLAVAVLELGIRECIAVATDPDITEHVCRAYRLWATETCFLEVSDAYVGVDYVVFDAERTFAVLFGDEFKLYGGPRRFVERATGRPIGAAREEFLKATWLKCVAERYESFNGDD